MSGHTPGPWVYDSGSFYAAVQLNDCGTTNEPPIIDMGAGRPEDSEANARLIAAAPDLLAALQMVRDADNDCRDDGLPCIPALARGAIDGAIAKATGAAP